MDDLVNQAKASCRSTAPATNQSESEETLEELFEKQLTCAICTELYLDPVVTIPCSHNFCGSCASRWLRTNSSCPSCRTKVKDTKHNSGASEMVEILLQKCPEKRRPVEEIEELKAIYKPQQKIIIYDDISDDDGLEDEDIEGNVWGTDWNPCPCCDPNNEYGYVCPQPILPATSVPSTMNTYRQHRMCIFCEQSVPIGRPEPIECSICLEVWCGNLFECEGASRGEHWITKYKDIQSNDLESILFFTVEGFLFNQIEHGRLMKFLYEHNMTLTDIGDKVREHAVNKGLIDGDTILCKQCVKFKIGKFTMLWWIDYQQTEGIVDSRRNCWYGYDCRTQRHNPAHAAKLNHACNPAPPEERRGGRHGNPSTASTAPDSTTNETPVNSNPSDGTTTPLPLLSVSDQGSSLMQNLRSPTHDSSHDNGD